MYIAPTSVIRFLSNCPLDNTYAHTLYFDTASAQEAYFISLTKYTLSNQSYQRAQRGIMRVALSADDLYNCNYIMFQNTEYGNKWFYAFITGIEYVNNATSEVAYEIDVMQTYMFDVTLEESFVEREHAATDYVGENTVDEGLETGDYITTTEANYTFDELWLFALATENVPVTGVPAPPAVTQPAMVAGMPLTCYTWYIGPLSQTDTMDRMANLIAAYDTAGKADSLIAMFASPNLGGSEGWTVIDGPGSPYHKDFQAAARSTPVEYKNNKLQSAPYCNLVIRSGGQSSTLRYELFSVGTKIRGVGGFGPNMTIGYFPLSYAGQNENLENTVTASGFPLCPWSNNYYQNWIAQNRETLMLSAFGASVPLITGLITGGVGSVITGASGVANLLAQTRQQQIIPDKLNGSVSAADIFAVSGYIGLYTACKTIRPEYGRIIDDYFTMYGYATRRVKVPNRAVRPHWTYTKTVGCNAIGNVPADDLKRICQVYDAGVTFWKNGSEVGNYSLDNNVGVPPHV